MKFTAEKNAYIQSPGKYHVYAENDSISQSEELAIEKYGAFRLLHEAKEAAARLNAAEDTRYVDLADLRI